VELTAEQHSPELLTDAHVHAEYTRRLDARRKTLSELTALDKKLGNARLVIFAVGVIMGWLAWGKDVFAAEWLGVPCVIFIALIFRHDGVIRKRERAQRAVANYEQGLRRLTNEWAGTGTSGSRFADSHHPYTDDLDIFGRGSLFELLCTARTQAGENCLAAWLMEPADALTIQARQEAVAELRSRLDLREELGLLGEEVRSAAVPEELAAWGKEPVLLSSRPVRVMAGVIAVGGIAALAAWGMGYGLLPLGVAFLIGRLFEMWLGSPLRRISRAVEKPAQNLQILASLLVRLEQEQFSSLLLTGLQAELRQDGLPPSVRIARLVTLIDWFNARYNQLFAPIAALLVWTTQFAFALESWRAENGEYLERWVEIIAEFEALCALSGYAYEHPADVFPELVTSETVLHVEQIAHPLLPSDRAVRNDVHLDEQTRLWIVSGSNMSGKSTLLRTIGTNVVLAMAGAPVRANTMTLTAFHLGASLRTQDSLQGGVSRFYAEITRLRQVVDIARETPPCLFLLDEILHGTNSHDRLIGAEAIARSLIGFHAFGLITTHDLALARIADDPDFPAVNVHFEDHIEDGQMRFDYQLRKGVVAKSNALELMRAVGLPV
jgi:hypothetical protein